MRNNPQPLRGKIDYIEPVYSAGSKTGRARVYLPNPGGRFLPGALLTATVQAWITLKGKTRQAPYRLTRLPGQSRHHTLGKKRHRWL